MSLHTRCHVVASYTKAHRSLCPVNLSDTISVQYDSAPLLAEQIIVNYRTPGFRRPRKEVLTTGQVETIRLSDLPDTHWAEKFGVNRSTIRRARCGGHYLHVSVPPQTWARRPRADIGSKRNEQPCEFDESIALPGEEWRPVFGWERFYRVSNLGRVYSLHQTGRLVLGMPIEGGYRVVKVRDGARRGHLPVHCMVLEAFVGPRPSDYEGCHNDGNPKNCRLDNLRWDTPQGNQADRVKHGTSLLGRKITRTLTPEIVRQIRTIEGVTDAAWAKRLGITAAAVMQARVGRTWKQVETPPQRRRA